MSARSARLFQLTHPAGQSGPAQTAAAPAQRDLPDDSGSTLLHVDMDAFYASVSLIQRPELRGLPVIIGGGQRGVVLSATYEARQFGVSAAMPMARARRLCPQARIIQPDYEAYEISSKAVMAIFAQVTPVVEAIGLDEAFLDVSGAERRLGRPAAIAAALRDQIADEVGITCSVGIGPTKLVAKIASGLAKPDGMLVVPADQAVAFLHRLPVGALWGVGEATEAELHRLGLRTVSQVAHMPVATLQRALGPHAGRHLHDLAWGRDDRAVVAQARERSVGNGRTFPSDVDDPAVVHRQLLALAESVASRSRSAALVGRTVTITVRFADFTTITRSRTLPRPTDSGREVYAAARGLYDALGLQRARIRMVRVTLSGISDTADTQVQGLLMGDEETWRAADRAVDQASHRFGSGVVRPASLLGAGREAS